MKYSSTIPVVLVLAALLGVGGALLFDDVRLPTSSSRGGKTPDTARPAQTSVEPGSGRVRVVLTERARERLGITTARVTAEPLTVPYAALLYEANGSTWVYTNPKDLVYVRQRIEVDRITGDRATLLSGPPAGTAVVTSGAAELLGVELGIGK